MELERVRQRWGLHASSGLGQIEAKFSALMHETTDTAELIGSNVEKLTQDLKVLQNERQLLITHAPPATAATSNSK